MSAGFEQLHEQARRWPGINAVVAARVDRLLADAPALRLGVEQGPGGCTVVDAGVAWAGGIEAGLRIAEICLGGLGEVSLQQGPFAKWPWQVAVRTSNPVLACLGSQYAGWSLAHGSGKGAFHALGSGPGRALARKEELFTELGYTDRCDRACLVLEVDRHPPVEVVEKVAHDCGVSADRLVFILTPTTSLAGGTQIVARALETSLHKAHSLGFPLHHVVDGMGSAPLPPPSGDFLTSMGRTNDAILFGGLVHLFVDCDDDAARQLAEQLPSSASRDYGKPFAQVFKACEYDFYRIDPMLFSPAVAMVTAMKSGRTYRGGRFDEALLDASFGEDK